MTKLHKLLFICAGLVALAACGSQKNQDGLDVNAEKNANYFAPDSATGSAAKARDPIRAQLASFFLVEHFDVEVIPSMAKQIATDQPGGILFWNGNKATPAMIRKTIRSYSHTSTTSGHAPVLFSADYEGGDLQLSPKGKMVAGIQRFHTGFTKLAQPIWLGLSMAKYGDELCRLHSEILSKELISVGINYPLATVSDLAMHLFVDRGISTNPALVTKCMSGIMASVADAKDIVFVTKHFPGLGQTVGDSHETVAMSLNKTIAESAPHLAPFANTIAAVNASGAWPHFSILASHGMYPAYDSTAITTESPRILQGLLRQQLGFKGIVVSDAMWMGKYGQMSGDKLMAAYLKAFVSGMDLLMVPGAKFTQALTFFRAAYDGSLSPAQKAIVVAEFGVPFEQVQEQFKARAKVSMAHIDLVRHSLPPADKMMDADDLNPTEKTVSQRQRYDDILRSLDTRWLALLKPQT